MEYTDENKIHTEKIHCELLYKCSYIEKPNSDELYTIILLYEKEESNKVQKKWYDCYAIIENVNTHVQEEYLIYSYSPHKRHTQLFATIVDEYRDCHHINKLILSNKDKFI